MEKQKLSMTAKKVLGFLVAKGLLHSTAVKPCANVKLTVNDFIVTAEEVEPRVLAVLPAAVLHFPRTFLDRLNFPEKLTAVLDAIVAGKNEGPALAHVQYDELKRWAYATLKDRRTKPLKERKVRKTYRFLPAVARTLERAASKQNKTETAILEELVTNYA